MSDSDKKCEECEELGRAMARAYAEAVAEIKEIREVPMDHPEQRTPPIIPGSTHWTVTCKQDSRFNMQGTAHGLISAEAEMDRAIRTKAKELQISDEDLDKLTIEVGAWKE